MKINSNRAFTLIEILIVAVIIGIIIAIALPNFAKSREISQRNACIANLKQINAAVDQWVIEKGVATGIVLSDSDEEEIYSNYLKGSRPKCPSGGTYTLHAVGSADQVTCSLADKGHAL